MKPRFLRRLSAWLLICVALGACAGAGPARARLRVRLDSGWRFRRDPLPIGTADLRWEWRLAEATSLDIRSLPADLNTGTWQPVRRRQRILSPTQQAAWFRAPLGEGPAADGRVLQFDTLVGDYVVFVNGIRVAQGSALFVPVDVPISAAWNARGPNRAVVLIRGLSQNGGMGGIFGPVTVAVQAPGSGAAEAAPAYNDRSWQVVHLPHDYVIDGPFERTQNTSHGSLPVAQAWYRKSFVVPAAMKGQDLWIDFDGVYRNSTAWLNGHRLGTEPSGYVSFRYDITPYVRFGGSNVLAVHVDPRRPEGWWYEGGGIYRHVWLNAASPLHVQPWGVFVQAKPRGAEGLPRPTTDLLISTSLDNTGAKPAGCTVTSQVFSPGGRMVASARTNAPAPAYAHVDLVQHATVPAARLWSLETPQLYRVETSVSRNGRVVDHTSTPFGIRTIRFDASRGFFLNGKSVKLKGTCNHQDHAGVGIGVPDSLQYWRIRQLKKMGSNAYRCSHNPPAPAILDACDRLGMLVMDENRHLGDTDSAKTRAGTPVGNLAELRSMLLRDRNHPSIIMWSMCNEEPLQGSPEGARLFAAMKKVTNELDPTRPVTCAMNGAWGRGFSLVEDLQGCNYDPAGYDAFHKSHPNMPMFGSETASTVSDRGIYANDAAAGYVSAYDLNFPPWAATAENAWRPIADRPYMAGSFAWTGFDYKGEPTPYGWPCINSHFGIMDICGFPKDNYYYYQSVWRDQPMVHLLPHWNWRGKEGQPIDVWCYNNADRVELFLNGRSLGAKPAPHLGHVEWQVPYAPGVLEARGYRGNRVIATDRVETTGPPAALRLLTDRRQLQADGEDTGEVEVQVVDAEGRVVPTASNLVHFTVSGAGHAAGVGNGDPSSHEPDRASQRHAFNGLCMVLVQSGDTPGPITLRAAAAGLRGATLRMASH